MPIHFHRRKRVYGIRKVHAELNRTRPTPVARCTVERLCAELGSVAPCVANGPGPPGWHQKPENPETWWNANSPPPHR